MILTFIIKNSGATTEEIFTDTTVKLSFNERCAESIIRAQICYTYINENPIDYRPFLDLYKQYLQKDIEYVKILLTDENDITTTVALYQGNEIKEIAPVLFVEEYHSHAKEALELVIEK